MTSGLGERLGWSGLLLGLGGILWIRWPERTGARTASALLAVAAAFHTLWYSLLLHNPLWTAQHVGTLPVLNSLIPLFALLPSLHLAGTARRS